MAHLTVCYTGFRGVGPILAIVAPGELFGGAERQILTLCRYLQRCGTTFHVFLFHDRVLAERLRNEGCTVEILKGRPTSAYSAAGPLHARFDQLGVRIVHVNGYKAAWYVSHALGHRRIAVIKTEHGQPELNATGLPARLKAHLYNALDVRATRRSNAFVVYVTQELRTTFEPQYGGLRSAVIYNGIESISRSATHRPSTFKADQFNIAVIGRLEPVKGVHLAIDAMSSQRVPVQVCLHVVGDGPLSRELASIVRRCGLESRVHLHGFRTDAYDYIAHADALLIPSLHEGLPYTLLEAMALETPVIAARVGGLREVLRDGRTALLFEPGKVAAIAEAMTKAAGDTELLETLKVNALQEVASRFSASAMGDAYRNIYERVGSGQ